MGVFKIKFEMNEKGITTFFKHKLFTVPKEVHQYWNYKKITEKGLNVDFKFGISEKVIKYYENRDPDVFAILKEMQDQKSSFTIKNNKGIRYDGNNQYIKCAIPEMLLIYFKKLFVSTIVFQAEKCTIPANEIVEFEFDTEALTVNVSSLFLYQPQDNPYYKYAKNSVASLSAEAIGLEQYSIDNTKTVKDFYNLKQMSKWKEIIELEKEKFIDDKSGVYMLYDEKSNTFYIGKAIKLKKGILKHQKNISSNEPIPYFTHYRYSVISGEYFQFLYLIENAAIHDCAWILDMPKAQKFTPSLVKKIEDSGKSLNECKMVNTHEHQTRKQ